MNDWDEATFRRKGFVKDWTGEWYKPKSGHKDNAKSGGIGPCPGHEKQQDVDQGQAHHKPKKTKVDETVSGKFRVSIDLLVSDQHRRDADGALSTLLDCLTHSAGRCSEPNTGDLRDITSGSQRPGRGHNND